MWLFPKKGQFKQWSLPSKVTYLGFWIAIFSLIVAFVDVSIGFTNLRSVVNLERYKTAKEAKKFCEALSNFPDIGAVEDFKKLFPSQECKILKPAVVKKAERTDLDVNFWNASAISTDLATTIIENHDYTPNTKNYLLSAVAHAADGEKLEVLEAWVNSTDAFELSGKLDKSFENALNATGECKLIGSLMPSVDIIGNEVMGDAGKDAIEIRTPSGKILSDFRIPDTAFQDETFLMSAVMTSESMEDEERQYWFNLYEVMNSKQIMKLNCILVREREKLNSIDAKYSNRSKKSGAKSEVEVLSDQLEASVEDSRNIIREIDSREIIQNFARYLEVLESKGLLREIDSAYANLISLADHELRFKLMNEYGRHLLTNSRGDGHDVLRTCANDAIREQMYLEYYYCASSSAYHMSDALSNQAYKDIINTLPTDFMSENKWVLERLSQNTTWTYLMINQPELARDFAQSIGVYRTHNDSLVNYAHALLLSGDEEAAVAIYSANLSERVTDGSWSEIVCADLTELKRKRLVKAKAYSAAYAAAECQDPN